MDLRPASTPVSAAQKRTANAAHMIITVTVSVPSSSFPGHTTFENSLLTFFKYSILPLLYFRNPL